MRGMQEASSVWTQQARGAGSWQEPRPHSHTYVNITGAVGGTGPMHATPSQLNVNTDTRITRGGPDSHPLAPGPHPAIATHTGARHGAE